MLEEEGKKGRKYTSLLEEMQERFEKGTYPVGSLLPTEDELCEEFQVSRYTLREALRLLERQGLIQRRRRAGTRVLAASPRSAFRHATGSYDDLLEFVRGTTIELSKPERIRTDGKLARLLGCDEMREWLYMEGVRVDIADDRPVGMTRIFIDPTRATVPEKADFGQRPVYEWLRDTHNIKIATVSQDISAVALTASEAETFGERPGAPALRIVRRYFDDQSRIVQIAVTVHRSEDFVYNTRLHLE